MVIGRKRVNFFDNSEDGEFRYEDHPLEMSCSDGQGWRGTANSEIEGRKCGGYLS